VKNEAGAIHGFAAIGQVSDVAFDEGEGGIPEASGNIAAMAGGEVVETNHFVVVLQQIFTEVGADEAGAAGDKDAGVGDCGLGVQGWRFKVSGSRFKVESTPKSSNDHYYLAKAH
jgi:hypothetical protein